jgi:filamentous hemagglutinin
VGGSPSQLLGYTEVAGQRAEVIIANPAGIFCNACGFINTNRGVLTTGTAVFGGTGSLDAFHVTGGQIQVGLDGLNAVGLDQVDLIARSVAINGQVWANKALNVVAGQNDVRYSDLSADAVGPDGNSPAIAIDVSQLGGMYAGKIRLVGTEKGVGVNSAGPIAARSGELMLSGEGKVTLSGRTSAAADLMVYGAHGVENTGSLYAGRNTSLSSLGVVSNSGVVAAQGGTSVAGSMVDSTGTLAAGTTFGLSASGGVGQSAPDGVNLNTPVKQVGSSTPGPLNSQGLGPSGFALAGTGDSASGTTHAAISAGTITVRSDTGTTQDSTVGLSRL